MNEYTYLCQELQKMIDSKGGAVVTGQCKDIEEYRNITGVIRGLALAIDLIKDREQKTEGENV